MARWKVKLLIDGECPVCTSEARLLRRLDHGRGNLAFEDITAPGFDPSQYGRTMDQLLSRIHAVLPGDKIVTGMEVFRRAYSAVGFGWLLLPTRLPIVRPVSEHAYNWLARHRVRLTHGGRYCGDHCRVA